MSNSRPNPFSAEDDASTPLDHDERQGLILSWVTYRYELNEVEQENILRGTIWAFQRIRRPSVEILDEQFIRETHKRMLGNVWKWAGQFRATERNIGVAPYQIAVELRNLIEDVKVWIEYQNYPPDEIIARFHHRLVAIHPFPNGNGRHARLMADLLANRLNALPLTWGGRNLTTTSELRTRYIEALRQADRGHISALLEFIRS